MKSIPNLVPNLGVSAVRDLVKGHGFAQAAPAHEDTAPGIKGVLGSLSI